jgi:hypothetical protein
MSDDSSSSPGNDHANAGASGVECGTMSLSRACRFVLKTAGEIARVLPACTAAILLAVPKGGPGAQELSQSGNIVVEKPHKAS